MDPRWLRRSTRVGCVEGDEAEIEMGGSVVESQGADEVQGHGGASARPVKVMISGVGRG